MSDTTTTPTVYVDIDGEPTPIDECYWFQVAPCGCTTGVSLAAIGDEVLVTNSQRAAYYDEGSETERDLELGRVWRLERKVDDLAARLAACPHGPQKAVTV